MKTSIFLSGVSLLALLGGTGCSSSSSPSEGPEISEVDVTDSPVPQNSDGSYTVDLTVTFDDDVDVDTYNFDSDAANIHVTDSIPAQPAGQFTLVVTLPNGTASGTVDFDISVVDINNVVSNDATGVVVLDQ